jgi:RNA polymerase sigma factor (sigma-70 family)
VPPERFLNCVPGVRVTPWAPSIQIFSHARTRLREDLPDCDEHCPQQATRDALRRGSRSCPPSRHTATAPGTLRFWSQPEQELLSTESRRLLSETIDGLPDHYRAVLVLRDVEGLSNEEVAEVLAETVASVKSKLHRARMALRERLTRHVGLNC